MPSLITLDFETYYADDYSLSKMTTEEYIRDPRFEVIGFSLKIDDQPSQWYSGDHEYLRSVLATIPWDSVAQVAHNNMFDAAILYWRFGFKAKRLLCTMAMARGLVGLMTSCSLASLAKFFNLSTAKGDEVVYAKGLRRRDFSPDALARYGRYCDNDNELCKELFDLMVKYLLPSELHLIDWTLECFVQPRLLLDKPTLELELQRYLARRDTLLSDCGIHDIGVLRSDETMANALMSLGVVPPTKPSPKRKDADGNPLEVYAFSKQDVEFGNLLEHDDERVVALVEARLGLKSSIVESRLRRFIGMAGRGMLPVPLEYCGATPTRRWAGKEKINLQNLPRNPKGGVSPLRAAIKAPPGFKMAAADLSQIELRVNCWQSGQRDVLNLLATGGDTYSDMASSAFGFAVDKKQHPNERFVGKTAVLGCGYQCGAAKFHHMLLVDSRKYGIALPDSSPEFAARIVSAFRSRYPHVRNFWYKAEDALVALASHQTMDFGPYRISDGRIWLPNGSYLYYPNLRRHFDDETGKEGWVYDRVRARAVQRVHIYGGKLVENVTQAVARLFVSDALLRLRSVKYPDGSPVFHCVFSVHDELVVLFRDGLDEKWVTDTLTWAMTTRPEWALDIPLGCEVGIGYNYADCK